MDEQAIRDLVAAGYDAFNRADYDADLALASDDIEIETVAFGEMARGKEAFRSWLQRWRTMAPDGRVDVVAQVIGKDAVTNEGRFTGTNTGPLEGPMGTIPPTGKRFEVQFVEVWRTRDGKISSVHNYSDTMTLLAQLGLMPQLEPVGAQ